MSAILPKTIPYERTRQFQDEWAIRWGVLMGGTEVIETPGIGQYWIGHSEIRRRKLTGFTRQQVGARNEAADSAALDEPGGVMLAPSPLESKRLRDKSPAVCMREAVQILPPGFMNSSVLMGDETTAEQIFNAVLPESIQVKPLVDVIEFLEALNVRESQFLPNDLKARAEEFRLECLHHGKVARQYMTSYTDKIADEINEKKSKHRVDVVDIAYFWELKKTLPEDKPLETTARLGKEIAGAFTQGNEREIAAREEANRLKAEELEIRRLELGQKGKPEVFKCDACGDEFDTARGKAMHESRYCEKQPVAG